MRITKSLGFLPVILFILTGCSHPSSAIHFKKQAELIKIEKPSVSNEDKLYIVREGSGLKT